MNGVESKLEVGDFVRNKIHKYVSILCTKYLHAEIDDYKYYVWHTITVAQPESYTIDFMTTGFYRNELPTELDKVHASLPLISKAKEYLAKKNENKLLDNLTYIEILQKLNEQEKALKNENPL